MEPGSQSADSADPTSTLVSLGRAPLEARAGGLSRGAAVGRYIIIDELGRGGMGIVYSAWHPELARKVALKVLHEHLHGRAHLLEEARLLGQIRERHVVTVHDAGEADGHAYFIMDYVEGTTVARWSSGARSRAEVVSVLLQVGRGLAAVHRSGFTHGDLKPGNVLVETTPEGPVARIIDFGLGRRTQAETDETLVGGTRAYMPPETAAEGRSDERSDQFSFAIVCIELLTGHRPPLERPFGARLSARLGPWHAALARACAAQPSERWPSMEALLHALMVASRRRRHSTYAAGALVVSSFAAAAFAGRETCPSDPHVLNEHWSAEQRTGLVERLSGGGDALARDTAQRVSSLLDGYAAAWLDARREACLAAEVREERSSETYQLALSCLNERRAALGALVAELSTHDEGAPLHHAIDAAARLPSPRTCTDFDALLRARSPIHDPALAKAVQSLREQIPHALTLYELGRLEAARADIERLAREAEALGHKPLLAEILVKLAGLQRRTGQTDEARTTAELAHRHAIAAGSDMIARDATSQMLYLESEVRKDDDAAAPWLAMLMAWNERLPEPSRELASALDTVAVAYAERDELDAARSNHERALQIRQRLLPPNHPDLAQSHGNLAQVAIDQGRFDDAVAALNTALSIRSDALGPDHPEVAMLHVTFGNAFHARGEHQLAIEHIREAIRIRARAHGATSLAVAQSRANLAGPLMDAGRLEEAEREARAAVDLMSQALPTDDPRIVVALSLLANVHLTANRLDEAAPLYERALDIVQRQSNPASREKLTLFSNLATIASRQGDFARADTLMQQALESAEIVFGSDHPTTASIVFNLGNLARRTSLPRLELAEERYRDALRRSEASVAGPHPLRATFLDGLGQVLAMRGRWQEAEPVFAEVLEIRSQAAVPPHERAMARVYLAQALHRHSERRSEAVALVRAALADLEGAEPSAATEAARAAATDWLRKHGRRVAG